MSRAVRVFVITVGCVFAAGLVGALLFCSSIKLPEAKLLANKAPADGGTSQIDSVSAVRNLFPALDAAVGKKGHEHYALQIARMVNTLHNDSLSRHFHEFRSAAYVRTHFSRDQRRTLLLNLAYFGDQQRGVHAASAHFYQRKPSELDVAAGAMLVGILRSPAQFSPVKHPDKALQQRNTVLDGMVAEGTLTQSQADAAKAEPLLPVR